jgi:hypothetical protein
MVNQQSNVQVFPVAARMVLYLGMVLLPLLAHLEVAIHASRVSSRIAIPAYNILLFVSMFLCIIAPLFIRRGLVSRVGSSILAFVVWAVLHLGLGAIMLTAAR